MGRIHPCYIQKAAETGEYEENIIEGVAYWANLINSSIGTFPVSEVPLIIAALANVTEVYARDYPDTLGAAKVITDNVKTTAIRTED